jgi:hypothetical protein
MARQAPLFQHPRGSDVFGDVVAILIVTVFIALTGAGTGVVLGALGASIGSRVIVQPKPQRQASSRASHAHLPIPVARLMDAIQSNE